jgi:hypothetical protein
MGEYSPHDRSDIEFQRKGLGDSLWQLRSDYSSPEHGNPEMVNKIDAIRIHLTKLLDQDPNHSYDTELPPEAKRQINQLIAGNFETKDPAQAAQEIYEIIQSI